MTCKKSNRRLLTGWCGLKFFQTINKGQNIDELPLEVGGAKSYRNPFNNLASICNVLSLFQDSIINWSKSFYILNSQKKVNNH